MLEEAGRLGLNEGSCIIFIRVVVVINMVFHFNVVDCQDLLEEARRLGLNGGSCRSLKPIVVVCCFTYFWMSLLLLKLFTAQSWLKELGVEWGQLHSLFLELL